MKNITRGIAIGIVIIVILIALVPYYDEHKKIAEDLKKATVRDLIALVPNYDEHKKIAEDLKKATVRDFRDPEASRFRDVRLYRVSVDGLSDTFYILCGEVNTRGLFGGYMGYMKFFMVQDTPSPLILRDSTVEEWRQSWGSVCESTNYVYRESE